MNVGVFLCLEPYTSLENNLRLAHEYGFNYADITDTHSGGSMFASAGLSASVSLDDNPFEVRRTFERNGMKIMTLSAHALLLEPSSPANFATSEIMKAIKFAAGAGIEYVITTETFAKSEWAKSLSYKEKVFTAAEKLYNPCRMAADYGIKLCLEQHGPLTDTIDGIADIMDRLGNPDSLGVNVFSVSLGYAYFDNDTWTLPKSALDGQSTRASRAATRSLERECLAEDERKRLAKIGVVDKENVYAPQHIEQCHHRHQRRAPTGDALYTTNHYKAHQSC